MRKIIFWKADFWFDSRFLVHTLLVHAHSLEGTLVVTNSQLIDLFKKFLILLQPRSSGSATSCLAWQLNASSQRTLTRPHLRLSPTSVSRSMSNSAASIAYYCQAYGK